MDYYFYNSDSQSMHGEHRFPVLIEKGIAATSGPAKYGTTLGRLAPGDVLLMFANKVGIVAIGTVGTKWNGKSYKTFGYYRRGDNITPPYEYRITVDWTRLKKPITFQELKVLGVTSPPRHALEKIEAYRDAVEKLIDEYGVKTEPSTIVAAASRGGGGENERHRRLKEYVANNPAVIRVKFGGPGQIERPLPSGDCLDVSFESKKLWVAVEVKSAISDFGDVARGLFQCVKYRAVMDAVLVTEGRPGNARAILVLESKLPQSLVQLKSQLGIEVIEGVKVV